MSLRPRGRPKGGKFQIPTSREEVLKRLGISEDDLWWRRLTVGLAYYSVLLLSLLPNC